jgi:hypothetical protein
MKLLGAIPAGLEGVPAEGVPVAGVVPLAGCFTSVSTNSFSEPEAAAPVSSLGRAPIVEGSNGFKHPVTVTGVSPFIGCTEAGGWVVGG